MNLTRNFERLKGRARDELIRLKLHSEWRREVRASRPSLRRRPPRRLLVLPCDPRTLAGSRGDEAMIQGVVQHVRNSLPQVAVAVITSSAEASAAASRMGFEAMQMWDADFSLRKVLRAIDRFAPDAAVVVGGDVMDGYYNPTTTTRLLAIADLMSRRGVRTSVLGFSFNRAPHASLRRVYDNIGDMLLLNVRDPISMARFRRFTHTQARLVADAAFLLPAADETAGVREVVQWVDSQRAIGRRILGFNLHPMLIKQPTPDQLKMLIEAAVQSMARVAARMNVSWLLLPHDYRGAQGDDACLAPIAAQLDQASAGEHFYHVTSEHSAAELKALAGLADGVCTGRMHLAIASLGLGVPVAALTYQDKFEGLFRHFDLPTWLLLDPRKAVDADQMEQMLARFVEQLDSLRAQVEAKLPQVKAAAELNLSGLL